MKDKPDPRISVRLDSDTQQRLEEEVQATGKNESDCLTVSMIRASHLLRSLISSAPSSTSFRVPDRLSFPFLSAFLSGLPPAFLAFSMRSANLAAKVSPPLFSQETDPPLPSPCHHEVYPHAGRKA